MTLNSFLTNVYSFSVIFVILGPNILSGIVVESRETQRNAASQLAVCLYKAFEENTGFYHLQKLYSYLSCVNQDFDGKRWLHNITKHAEIRLNTSMRFLQDLKERVQQLPSHFRSENVTKCCRDNLNASLAQFSDRLRSSVDLTKGCSVGETSEIAQDSVILNSELLNGFQGNFNKSSVVAWQYYGSINGEYLQYPANSRYCGGSISQFDPRFKSWYVEAASPVKKNLVIIIDRSGSMSGSRMKLAKDAALTVLDTLSPHDNVGLVAFSSFIETPSGCFGSTVATGIPANLDKLREWLRKIYANGLTHYAKAFRHAFSMFQNVTRDQSSGTRNIILFLTDGDPTDSEAGIYQAVEEGQSRMNHSIQINTYALGAGLSSISLRRLRRIAFNNSGVFQEIRDQNEGVLKRTMASYYTSMKTPFVKAPKLSLPHMDSKLGLKVTMSLALTLNGSFIGVVALDLPLKRLFKEALQHFSTSLSYAVLVDNGGRAILHPSVPGPADVTSSRSFLPLKLFEPALPPDIISNITAGRTGHQNFEASFSLPLGDRPTDGTHPFKINATYLWSPVRGSDFSILCVVADGQSLTTDLTSFRPTSQIVPSFYHRLDLSWNATVSHPKDVCRWNRSLISPSSSTVKITPDAFNDADKYIYSEETLKDLQDIQLFFNDHSSQAKYKGQLSEAIRAEVKLTSALEGIWQRADLNNPDLIAWRFIGTQKGVLKVYPGLRLQKTYSHKHQPWFIQAVSSPDNLMVSLRSSAYQPLSETMLSLSKSVRKTSCGGMELGNDVTSHVLAVIGMEMTESAFLQLIADKVDFVNDKKTDWYMLDTSGYIMFNFSRSAILPAHKKHLTEAIPWLANELIRKEKIFKASWCNNYQQHTVEMFYELSDSTGNSTNSTDPCHQFSLNPVPGTSLLLLGIPSGNIHHCTNSSVAPEQGCSCGMACTLCSSDVASTCQCPCACHMPYDKCDNSVTRLWTSTPCPVPAPPLFETEKEEVIFENALAAVPRCARDCPRILNMIECNKTVGCHWCTFKPIPSCNSECRTGKSLLITILFPCNDFWSLSAVQQHTAKYLFKRNLMHLVSSLTTLSLEVLQLRKEGILFKLYESSANNDLKTIQEDIQRAVTQDKIRLGPAADLPKVYIAKSPEDFTDLNICLTLDKTVPQASQAVRENIESELQLILNRLLGKSFVTRIRHLNINKTSVQFFISNEGYTDLYPLQSFKERLEKAVRFGELSLNIPLDSGEAIKKKLIVINISALGAFDFLCHPYTSTPVTRQSKAITSQAVETQLKMSRQTTPYRGSTSATTTGRSKPTTPTEQDNEIRQGLTPVEIAVVITASILVASSLPCILCLLLTRKRPKTRKGKVSPHGDLEEDLQSEISELSEIDANFNIIVNRAYIMHEESRIYRSPKEAWARAKELTIPKHVPKGAWF